jgi:hypothetical protein
MPYGRDLQSKPAYWHEAYHTLFWCDNLVGDKDKPFERCPVAVDIDPRLFRNPGECLGKNELLGFLSASRSHVIQRLGDMTDVDFARPDSYGKGTDVREFDVVLQRVLYGFRHG